MRPPDWMSNAQTGGYITVNQDGVASRCNSDVQFWDGDDLIHVSGLAESQLASLATLMTILPAR